MIKIYYLGITIIVYVDLYGNQCPDINVDCPKCNNRKTHKHGHYKRTVYTKYFSHRIPIYRWCCPECGKTISLMPPFLIPYARFYTSLRESAIKRRMNGESYNSIAEKIVSQKNGGLSNQTVKRWWKKFVNNVSSAANWISGELIKSGEVEDILRLHSTGVNPDIWHTIKWFFKLAHKYVGRFKRINIWGLFTFINPYLPCNILL